MQEKTETKQKLRDDSSQDVCCLLASIFKDIYANDTIGEDTFSNVKTHGRSSHHDRYVEELQQAHSEYEQHIKEADMLRSHITQARAQATAKERQSNERMREKMGDCLQVTVKSAFSWCVDENLLKNLISPQDVLTIQPPRMRASTAESSSPAKATIGCTLHTSPEPQDDEYIQNSIRERTVLAMTEFDHSLTFESSSDTPKRKNASREPDQTKPRPRWKDELSAKDRAEGWEKLKRLKDRHSFLRNPRFLPTNTQRGGRSLIQHRAKVKTEPDGNSSIEQSAAADPVAVFLPNPPVVIFTDYSVGHLYKTTLELRNMSSSSHHVRVIPPTTPYFSIGLGRFPSDGSIVAPGMSCKYMVRFTPDSLGDYKDFIVVETQSQNLLVVPIEARRPPPILTLSKVLNCGYCLVGGVRFIEFLCQNIGHSPGTFCIIPKSQWPASNLKSVAMTYFSEQPPFAVGPSLFVLQPGEATVVEVVFFPTSAEKSHQLFTIVCDNCQVEDISIEGEGQRIALELVFVSGEKELPVVGEVRDLTAEHFVRFGPCNPHSVQHKMLVIRNNVNLELPYHWKIMKPNLHPLLPRESPESSYIQFHPAIDDVFHVNPLTGILAPCQDQEFLITFHPKDLKDYHSVCHLVLRDVPQMPPEPCESSVLKPVQTGSKVSDVIIMEVEVKGSTEPYRILLEPYAVIIPGDIFICTTVSRPFKMWNHSKTFILFQWESLNSGCHTIEVEPSAGRIEENECFDFNLIVTGGKPEKVVSSLICNIQHRHEPISLPIEVSFKGPRVNISVPSIDFGLVKLGEETHTTFLLTNATQVEATWMLERESLNSSQDHQDTQISVTPCRGTLSPLASCTVEVLFRSYFCQLFETELELTVENGEGCHLWMRADVQSPQVCLLNCKLVLPELYIGVPTRASVTLFNQTLLPSQFSWMHQLQGKEASRCTATFDPSSGILGPNRSMEITVNFTSHADLTEVAALCEIEGMSSPLVLGIVASETKKLNVTYSLPSVCPPQNDVCPSPLVLDFGDDVVLKKSVTKQLLITNQTAIPAPFSIEAEYFTCHASRTNSQSEKRFTYIKNPLLSLQSKKVEARERGEFVSSVLAHGKGAAFLVLPASGLLEAFETLTVDVTAYSDMWGDYRDQLICKVGELEPMLIPMQMTVKGCPLYFQLTGPQADDQYKGPVIYFGTHMSGGDTVSRALRINNPTMFDIRLDWDTYNKDYKDHKLIDVIVTCGDPFPLKDADGNEVLSRTIKCFDIQTAGVEVHKPDSDGATTSLQSDVEEEGVMSERDQAEEGQTCLYHSPAKEKLISVHIRPHLGNLSDYPYCITPQQIVIPAKSSGTIHVSFTPLTLSESACESKCVGLALGFMSLDSQMAACVPGKVGRVQALDLEPIRMDLLAAVTPAVLLVQMEEDGGVLEFNASAGDLLRAESDKKVVVSKFDVTQTFHLKNTLETPLHFRLETQPPFSVLKSQSRVQTSTSSNAPNDDSYPLVLRSQDCIRVKVAFHCSFPLLDTVDQAEEKVLPGVMLIHSEHGQKKLRFEQNLQIHFSNSTLQTVPLRAHLCLPTLSLSVDTISFGFCFVGQTQTREVKLYVQGAYTYWTSLISNPATMSESGNGKSQVFRLTPDFGLLRSTEPHVTTCSQHLQLSFTPSEDREFRALVIIKSPLVKIPVTLQLQGTGSFDEVHMSKHMYVSS